MEVDIKKLETADYDILENIRVALVKVWKFRVIEILSAVIGALLFLIIYFFIGNSVTYTSTASIFSTVYGSSEETFSGVSMMNTYSQLIGTYRVCDRAAEDLTSYGISSEELHSLVSQGYIYISGASSDSKSYGYSLTLVVNYNDSEAVCDITNAMAQAFADEINGLLGNSSLQVLDQAKGYSSTNSINFKLFLLIFAAASFALSCGVVFFIGFFDRRVYSIKQCELDENKIIGIVQYSDSMFKE